MENAVFDPALVQRLTNRLYSQARMTVIRSTLLGAVLFAVIFYYASSATHNPVEFFGLAPIKAMGVGMLIGVVLGFIFGQNKAYQLKLNAQLALCQLKIEKNTRNTGTSTN